MPTGPFFSSVSPPSAGTCPDLGDAFGEFCLGKKVLNRSVLKTQSNNFCY